MNFFRSLGTIAALAYFAVLIAGIYGYVANIVKLVGLIGGALGTEVVIRAVGIFAFPLGAIAGFF